MQGLTKSTCKSITHYANSKNDEPDETEPGLTDYYDKDEGNGLGDLALYIKHLEIFFSLYIPSLTDKHKAVLKRR